MKNTLCFFFYMFLAFCIFGCHDHEDAGSQDSSSSAVLVTVVFYPGQVGDHGYADGLMDSVPQIAKLQPSGKCSHIDTQFFAFDSKRETQRSLQYWAAHPENPFLGGNYQRRLLVLTDARQVAWLDQVQARNPQDELLLLNASASVVDSLAQSWGNRVHALNISVAHEVTEFCQYIKSRQHVNGMQNSNVDVFKMAESYHTGDSIAYAFNEMHSENFSVSTTYMEEWQEDSITGEINYVSSQQYAHFLAEFYYQYNPESFLFLDGGSYNLVFDELSPKDGAGFGHTLFLDLYLETNNFCIWRQYGHALIGWIADWVNSSSSDVIPRITWHGSWDGYVESNKYSVGI